MSTILSFPERGPWGDRTWPGNCSGHVYHTLFALIKPKVFVDPIVGSGTSVAVAREMGIEGHGLDLHNGFNILRQSIVQAVGKAADFVFSHPPYHNIIVYSGNIWGEPHPDDLSRCEDVEEFLEKPHLALLNQRDATRAGGHFGCLIGDVRGHGRYHSLQAELIARLPAHELKAVLIKEQHHVRSEMHHYANLRWPRIMHEYIVIWQRPRVAMSLLDALAAMVRQALIALGGQACLGDLYGRIAQHAADRLRTNPHWQAKVRQTLQLSGDFRSPARGVWALAA